MPSPQSSRWCFTINNPTQQDKDHVAALGLDPLRKYLVVGREQGESGTPHLQGFVVFTRALRRARVSNFLPRAHLETARASSDKNATYCKKQGDFDEYGELPVQSGANGVLQPFYDWGEAYISEHGFAPSAREIAQEHPTVFLRYPRSAQLLELQAPPPVIQQGEPNDGWQQDLEGDLDEVADDRKIRFYVDVEGGKGKTWFQQWYLSKFPQKVQVLSIGKRDDIAHSIDVTKSIFFFNVPRTGMEYLQYTILEQLKDQMVFSPKYNSTTKILRKKPWVIVFCNEDPDYSKMSDDRYEVINL